MKIITKILKFIFYLFIFLVELCSSFYLIKAIKADYVDDKNKTSDIESIVEIVEPYTGSENLNIKEGFVNV